MQSLKQRRLGKIVSSDAGLGVAAISFAVVVLAVLAIVHFYPVGQQTVSFMVNDASAIQKGQEVRVAGVSVGHVKEVQLQPDRVRVTAEIDKNTFVGDRTKLQVRMLTPVGGYAISLLPAGRDPQSGDIPSDRVTVPYSIGDVLQAAPSVTARVNTKTVNASLKQVGQALQSNDTTLRSIVAGLDSVTTVFDKQLDQVHRIAALASEYLRSFNANREMVFALIKRIDTVTLTYLNSSAGFNYTYKLMGNTLQKVNPFILYYLKHTDQVYKAIKDLQTTTLGLQNNLGPAIDGLMLMRDQLARWITPQGMRQMGGGTVWMDNLCVPVAGRVC